MIFITAMGNSLHSIKPETDSVVVRKHSKQISFRADPELANRIEAAAAFEELALADFVRKIFRVAMMEYDEAGSLHALRAKSLGDDMPSAPAKKKAL